MTQGLLPRLLAAGVKQVQLPVPVATNKPHGNMSIFQTSDLCSSTAFTRNTRSNSQKGSAEAASDTLTPRQTQIGLFSGISPSAGPDSVESNPVSDSVQSFSSVEMPQSQPTPQISHQLVTDLHRSQLCEGQSSVSWLLRTEPALGFVTTAEAVAR